MSIQLTVLAADQKTESYWTNELRRALDGVKDVRISPAGASRPEGQIVFIDGSDEVALTQLNQRLDQVDRRGRAVFLIVREGGQVPHALIDGRIDDLAVAPFRTMEILSKLYHFKRLLMWNEVSRISDSVTDLVGKFHEDLRLAERLQKAKLPRRFPDMKGLKFASRYIAGARSGGDHFDLAGSKDDNQLSMVMSDSSSYGLSSSLISVLMRVALKLTGDEVRSCQDTVRRIHDELALTLKERDRLSLFYGVVSLKDYRLRYVNLGSSVAFYSSKGKPFKELASQAGAINRLEGFKAVDEVSLALSGGDRIVLVTDGFVEAAGGVDATCYLLDRYRDKDPADTLNELSFKVKSKLEDPNDLPEQDCSVLVIDVDPKLMKLAS